MDEQFERLFYTIQQCKEYNRKPALIIDFSDTRPAITQCTGRDTEEEIYCQFGFPSGKIIDLSELG